MVLVLKPELLSQKYFAIYERGEVASCNANHSIQGVPKKLSVYKKVIQHACTWEINIQQNFLQALKTDYYLSLCLILRIKD